MPPMVVLALSTLALGLAMAPVRVILRASWVNVGHDATLVALETLLVGLWLYGLMRRKRWLWWVTTILLVLGALTILFDSHRQGQGAQFVLYVVQCVSTVGAAVMFVLGDVRRWFGVSAA